MDGAGKLLGLGVGPGDPELLTIKAARLLRGAPVVAWFARSGRTGHARRIADDYLAPDIEELRFTYPFTTEIPKRSAAYREAMKAFYDEAAARLSATLDDGRDVALLCEGDPLFYGSFMYMHDRLAARYETEIVPGVTAMAACWSRAGAPMTRGDDCLSVLAGTLDEDTLAARLKAADAAVVMKVGRHLGKVRRALDRAGLSERAIYVENGSTPDERIVRLSDMPTDDAPYFSLVLVPSGRATS
ncbi:MAG: precorrin-2 C(20)-methyltransferase [Rhodospirillaceae bacterium]|nr:precorrin-2 C(20)-methyltransferase [Rhodospirillaceae bacterium]MYB15366.1 precorrin-2 C(20)-methyltransferase [Rhodospirillaceae bacterium]MYI47974.1 precorrin-2 C(20)-methyltransferase [Rhodospirillaceae bacterium]